MAARPGRTFGKQLSLISDIAPSIRPITREIKTLEDMRREINEIVVQINDAIRQGGDAYDALLERLRRIEGPLFRNV